MASFLDDQGEYKEAEILFLEALKIRRKSLHQEHPSLLKSLYFLSRFYRGRGNFAKAKMYLKEASIICVSNRFKSISKKELLTMAFSLFDWVKSLYNLGEIIEINGEEEIYADAESFYNSALIILTECLGSDDQTTLSVQESFQSFLTNVIKQGKTAYLSDHSITLKLIREIQSRNE